MDNIGNTQGIAFKIKPPIKANNKINKVLLFARSNTSPNGGGRYV